MKNQGDIAIIGMSGVFPGAGNIQTFWENITQKVDAIGEVPKHRWDTDVYYDPDSSDVDRFYCRRGGFIDDYADFDPISFGIVPITVEGTEPDQLLSLKLAYQALKDAGTIGGNKVLEKTGIIIGKGNYLNTGLANLMETIRTSEQIVSVLQSLLPDLPAQDLSRIKKEFQNKKRRFGPDTVMGLIPNLTASLVANRLNLGGAAYTVDAACASSLIAVDQAINELNSRRCDMMVAGGVHVCEESIFYSVFTQLGALSRTQQIRPFDQEADGLLIGEGCGMLVLKRMEDAIKDENRIYAVIKGVGISSDGASSSLMSPSVSGQARAIRQAWDKAGLDLRQLGYIEAHGTATPLGDKTELNALSEVFGKNGSMPKVGIGSVKSMIGHAMPAAGVASIIKTTMALHHGQLPPTLHCDTPSKHFNHTRFEPVQETIDWSQTDLPRVAGVNAFGFGGINTHLVIEAARPTPIKGKTYASAGSGNNLPITEVPRKGMDKDEVLLLARESKEALLEALKDDDLTLGEGHHRLAVFNPTEERIQKAIKIVTKGKNWRNRNDIWYTFEPMLEKEGKIVFLFPGLDGLSEGDITSVMSYFDLEPLDHPDASELVTSATQVFETSKTLDYALRTLGIKPDMAAGHSLGEWIACFAVGIIREKEVLEIFSQLNPDSVQVPDVFFLAVGCGKKEVEDILSKTQGVTLSHDNCPHQIIICGQKDGIEQCQKYLNERQIFNQVLPFQSGFHTPFFEPFIPGVKEGFQFFNYKAHTPMWSATTTAPYPQDKAAIIELSTQHLVNTVRFRELIDNLYDDGARMFIQIGTGGLVGFTDDTLKGRTFSSIASCHRKRSGINQLQRVLAAVYVEGHDVDLSFLNLKKVESLSQSSDSSTIKPRKKGFNMKLELGLPLVKEMTPLSLEKTKVPKNLPTPSQQWDEMPEDTVMRAFRENFQEMDTVQQEIVQLFKEQQKAKPNGTKPASTSVPAQDTPATPRKTNSPQSFEKVMELSLTAYPDLIDHCIYGQKEGWPHIADLFPVLPMTMIIQLLAELAQEQATDRKIIKIQNVQAHRWVNVATPLQMKVKGNWREIDRLYLEMTGYAQMEVVFGPAHETPPTPKITDLGEPRHIPMTEKEVYTKRYMFHGPTYQGLEKFVEMGSEGFRCMIKGNGGKGALLDNAGQLFGLWCHFNIAQDHVAFPVKIKEMHFYGDIMEQEGLMESVCKLTSMDENFIISDMEVKKQGQVWLAIKGWQNRRLGMDKKLWNLNLNTAQARLSEEIGTGICLFEDTYRRASAWDGIKNRYLCHPEKNSLDALLLPQRKKRLMGRVAAKDAVRAYLGTPLYPAEVAVENDPNGAPRLIGDLSADISISIAHKGKYAVAIAGKGKPVGIDIEKIEEREPGFISLSFHEEELALIPEGDQEAVAVWITRYWVAKEAYGKSLGVGLKGNPKNYQIEAVKDNRLRIKNTWINTIKLKNHIIGWTE